MYYLFLILACVIAQEWLNVTSNYTALMSDLNIDLLEPGIAVQLYEANNDNYTLMGTMPVDRNWQNITIHCGVITKGGHYIIQLISNNTIEYDDVFQDGQTVEFDVRWPGASLSFEPKRITTYPDPWQQVVIIMKFEGPQCEPAVGSAVPMLWLDLIYCGLSANACKNVSRESSRGSMEHLIVHSEQIRGYPRFRKIPLKCDIFGIAGFYTAVLRPPTRQTAFTHVMDGQLEVFPSNKFTLDVDGKSLFHCDNYGGGVPVTFQYPSCILPTSDKIRLFGRQREDVSTLLPPTKLHYISEHRIIKGRHSVYFDCELFSEKYIEYCFVYVNQAINRAYTNIKTKCVPTSPITEDDSGQWSKWSEWSPCSTTCYGGTRNRYRTCDSPPPKYGAKFCQFQIVKK
ncbi:thrombospondin type-1 domain-containing protein 1 isoform X2 [Aphis craccivora]|uniref:Thrombospondin type-1 domain-containing protein 1 isoform X2 n=1 Tax=Aphis craccivora TaxID=307492 RepID=A0A6G0YEH4_APHCR|nr:thrombospondin type-1 domain-containing protein 1 isoform X2 [Aphis craccivora]